MGLLLVSSFTFVTSIIAFDNNVILFLTQVSPGSKCEFAQDVVAMNTAQKDCCVLGELSKKVVVTPDLDSLEL